MKRWVVLAVVAWVAGITALHVRWNLDWSALVNQYRPPSERKLTVAYIPVT